MAGSITQHLEEQNMQRTLKQTCDKRLVFLSSSDTPGKYPDQRNLWILPQTNYSSNWQVQLRLTLVIYMEKCRLQIPMLLLKVNTASS